MIRTNPEFQMIRDQCHRTEKISIVGFTTQLYLLQGQQKDRSTYAYTGGRAFRE